MNCWTPPKGRGDFSKSSGVRVMESIPPAIDDVGHARADVGRRLLDRHHPGGALALHRATRRVGREPEGVGHVAGGAAAPAQYLAEHQVVDVVGLQPGRLYDTGHGLHADVRNGEPGQGATRTPDRRAGGGHDDGVVGFGHWVCLLPAKTGIVNSSEMGWNATWRAMPTCSSSKGQSTTLVIMRGPSARSTMAAT